MPPQPPPLDEVVYREPNVLASVGGLSPDTVMWYFFNSPFFEVQSNNMAVLGNINNLPNGELLRTNWRAFEDHMRKSYLSGISFVLTGVPEGPGQPYVIQKQNWVQETQQHFDHHTFAVHVLATYYTVGEMILKAPSLLAIVQARLLTITNNLQRISTIAEELSHYSPATGYTYMPPSYEYSRSAAATQSRAGSVAPSELEASQLAAAGSQTQAPASASSEDALTTFNDDFFLSSLNLTNRYAHEYMDENPLQGEPGSFVFASTKEQVEARNKAAAAAQQASGANNPPTSRPGDGGVGQPGGTGADTGPTTAVATPKGAPTPKPLPSEAHARKGSVSGAKKAEKRKKGLVSPISPTAP